MAVYNTEKYVWESIESVLQQTYNNFEFIIIDDWSTDWSRDIISQFAEKDKRIRAYSRENKGLIKTRNELLSYVSHKSQYLWILDSDDYISFSWLEKFVSYLQKNKWIACITPSVELIDHEGEFLWKTKSFNSTKELIKFLPLRNTLSHWGSLLRVSTFKEIWFYYDMSFERAHDYELRSRCIWNWFVIHPDDWIMVTLSHRIHPNQWKIKFLKTTLLNDIRIKLRFLFIYSNTRSISLFLMILLYSTLMLFPSRLVYFLFILQHKVLWKK